MSYQTICLIWSCAVIALTLGVPAWLIFFPPHHLRLLPSLLRLPLAILAAQAGIFGLFYCLVYPASNAYAAEHPNELLLGLCTPPSANWHAVVAVSVGYFAVRFYYLMRTSLTSQKEEDAS